MLAFIIRRLISTVLVMGLVGVFIFLLLHLSPGDPAAIIAGDNATPAQIAAIRNSLGLDDPLHLQFARWAVRVLNGDLGISIFSNVPVATLIGQRLWPTVSLAFTTIVLAVALALAAGVLAAWKAGSLIDRLVMILSVVGFSLPVFVVGYLLIYVFAISLRWLPVQGYSPMSDGFWAWASHLILPSLALGLAYVALLIGGVVITETVFNLPGIGRLVVDAISKRDYPIIQGVILLFSGVYVIINLLVD